MITDAQLRFSAAQSLAGAANTVLSTNTIDLGAARNIGRGEVLRLVITVDQAFTGGTALQVNVMQSPNPDMSGATVIGTGNVVTDANLPLGSKYQDTHINQNTQRYIALQYITTGTHTTGSVSAHIVRDSDQNAYYPANTGF